MLKSLLSKRLSATTLEAEAFSFVAPLDGVQFEEKDGDKKGTWLQALPLGEYQHPIHGTINITTERIKRFAANINNKVRGTELDIDYAHKKDPAKGEKAAGWITKAEDRGKDGLYIYVEFTDEAAKEIKAGEWKYFSPEFIDEWTHPKTKKKFKDVLFGGALTNRPFLKDIAPINLAELFDTPEGKYPQEDSSYREAYDSMRRCLNCAFFREPNQCLIVDGEIDKNHVSKFFQSIRSESSLLYYEEVEAGLYDPSIELREIPKSKRDKMPAEDFAGKDRSFPIETPEDVSAAVRSIGRAGSNNYDSATLKANIIRIAKRKGAAFVARLPKSWNVKAEEEVELEEFLKKLREALGLPQDAPEDKVLSEVGNVKKFFDEKSSEDAKARKFAEEFPEEAKALEEARKSLALSEAEVAVRRFEEGGDRGIPTKLHDKLRDLRMGLSAEQTKEFDEIFDTITKDGLVDLTESGSTERTRNGETSDADELDTLIEKKLEEHRDDNAYGHRQALADVLDERPDIAKRYRAPVTA